MKVGVNGGKREGERSEQESVVPRQKKEGANGGENARASVLRSEGVCSPVRIKIPVASADMRRHSDTLRAANAATKEGSTGRKQNKRSEFCCLPVFSERGVHGEKTG